MQHPTIRRFRALSILACVLLVAGCATEGQPPSAMSISVLSGRPDMVSGGDALIRVSISGGTSLDQIKIERNGEDVTSALAPSADGQALIGLVSGLEEGANSITAQTVDGKSQVELALTNYPTTGPIVSGPHLKPFVCRTEEAGLGAPLDENCTAKTKIEYFYRSEQTTPPSFVVLEDSMLDPSGALPEDIAETTTSEGKTVPYIVRVESGTINRAIYRIAVLFDPTQTQNVDWTPGSGWNQRLAVSFGGGCGTNYNQGNRSVGTVLSHLPLSRGFAHMVSSQNVMQQNCNDHLSAEALMMLKEHFIETYGVPKWTVGIGGSGGAIQQLLITQNFPGLLDGIQPSSSFSDSFSTRSGVTDCRLLNRFFQQADGWSDEQRTAVEGYTAGTCGAWDRSFIDIIVASIGCGIPEDMVYDPETNPQGARCTIWDTNVNTVGRDPETGWARRTLDNVGVQYGLLALNQGAISLAQFLDLNNRIGGYDNDGNLRAERTVADPLAVRLAYQGGRVNSGGGGLATTPILNYRGYRDPQGDIHDFVRDFQIRARLVESNGRADNQAIWIYSGGDVGRSIAARSLDTMSQWLDNLAADTSGDPQIDKVVRAKPAAAVDACWDEEGALIEQPLTFEGEGRCGELYPASTNPRIAAGGPLLDSVLKCQLQPVEIEAYEVELSAEELQQIRKVFPQGVCDYTRPGLNQSGIAATYQRLPLADAM